MPVLTPSCLVWLATQNEGLYFQVGNSGRFEHAEYGVSVKINQTWTC